MTRFRREPIRVVVAGGGVAALETCLALRDLAGDRIALTLVAPNSCLVTRPQSVNDPLAVAAFLRTPLAHLARAAAAELVHDRVVAIDTGGHRVYLQHRGALAYDALVVAVGAVDGPVPDGAVPYDRYHGEECRRLIQGVREGGAGPVAFVEPPAPARALDLYDLVLAAAVAARQGGNVDVVTAVTPQAAPLAILGERTSAIVGVTLAGHGVRVVPFSFVSSIGDGVVGLAPGARRLAAERVVALPRLVGPRLDRLPSDSDGFVRVDLLGRVVGVDSVFAAGDCTAFPVKHPSLAAEQAMAVASTIAADAGADVIPAPFEPVLRGMLPTRRRWFVEAPLRGGLGDCARVVPHAPWSGETRFGARYLAPSLEEQRSTRTLSVPAAITSA